MTIDEFNDIIYKYNRKLFSTAFHMLRNRQEAEDVVQDVFVKMWLMGNKIDEYNDIGALGVTITKNNCLDLIRKWKFIDNNSDLAVTTDPDPSPSPCEKLVITENEKIMNRIIDDLPPLYRDLVQLREINGLSYEEIASQKNLNTNTLRVTLSRARKIIKAKYLKFTNERG